MAVKDQNIDEADSYAASKNGLAFNIKFILDSLAKTSAAGKFIVFGVPTILFVIIAIFGFSKGYVGLGIFGGLILSVGLMVILFRVTVRMYRPAEIVMGLNDTELEIDNRGTFGTARHANEAEKKEIFERGSYAEILGDIAGRDPETGEYASVRRVRGANGNVLVFGSAGAGKTTSILIPSVMQLIRREESAIISDPKGELYAETSLMARAHGYTVKALVLQPEIMNHSDAVDFMRVVGNNDLKADSLAKTIISNTMSTDKEDFWDKQEMNLLKAGMLLVAGQALSNDTNAPNAEAPTLPTVYKRLIESTSDEIAEFFGDAMTWDNPAKGPGSAFVTSGERVQGDTKGGLAVRLGALNNKILKAVSGTDDVDFKLPGKEKCIYYVLSSSTDKTLLFFQSMFFTLLFQELYTFAQFETESGSLPVKVNFLMEEFKNVGLIPNFPNILATCRGLNMDIMMILQNLGQLQAMYPENEWTSIVSNSSTLYCLAANDPETLEFFEKECGISSIIVQSERYFFDPFDASNSFTGQKQITKTPNKRNVMNADEIRRMKANQMLVIPPRHNPVVLEKAFYFNHPMCKELRKTNIMFHVPAWMQDRLVEALESEDYNELRQHGVTEEDVMEWLDNVNHDDEILKELKQHLCTEEDFLEPWTNGKQKELDIRLTGRVIKEHLQTDEFGNILDDDATGLADMLLGEAVGVAPKGRPAPKRPMSYKDIEAIGGEARNLEVPTLKARK